jgi:hypothetical protein
MAVPVYRDRLSSRFALLALGLAVVGASAMLYFHVGLFMPRVREVLTTRNLAGGYAFGNDFYPIWLTSRECLRDGRDPYSDQMTREIQVGLFGRPLNSKISTDPKVDYRTFAYPAFTDLLFWPAEEFPFPALRVALVLLLAVLVLVSVLFWLRALSWRLSWPWLAVIFLLTLFSYQVLEGLYAAQLGLLVGCLLAAAMLALQRGRLLLAGILMALTTIKPQMTALAIFYLILWSSADWRRRKAFCLGLFSTTLALVVSALVVWPYWVLSWTHVILGYHHYAEPQLVVDVFAIPLGYSATAPIALAMISFLLIVAMIMAWKNRACPAQSIQFWLTLSLLLCITVIALLPGQAVHDHVILLPGLFLLSYRWQEICSSRIQKMLLATGVGVLLWPWVTSLVLIALHPFLSHERFYSEAIFSLPMRMAAVFPFVVLGGLTLAARSQKLRRETIELSVSR